MKIKKVIILTIFVCITLITMGNILPVVFQITELTNTATPSLTIPTNTPEPVIPIAPATNPQKDNTDVWNMIAGGIIGIVGTLIGSLVNHWLTIQRDTINRKEQEKDEIRKEIIKITEKHNLARIPFHGGDSLYFPDENADNSNDNIQSKLDKLSSDLEIMKEILEKTVQSVNNIKSQQREDDE